MTLRKFWDLNNHQRNELGKFALDLAKIMLGATVIKFFEPGQIARVFDSFLSVVAGLTIAAFFVMLGLHFLKERQ